jgi:hypothetical protein
MNIREEWTRFGALMEFFKIAYVIKQTKLNLALSRLCLERFSEDS